jgi:hypothetical protein
MVVRGGDHTWLMLGLEPFRESTERLADMLTPDEGREIRHAFAASATFSDMVAIGAVVSCHLCAIPASLRDPAVTWPDCDCG